MRHREWHTSHSQHGFAISVTDRSLRGWLAERVSEAVLAGLGHPCCGRGIGRIPGIDIAAWYLLNWPSRFARHDVRIIEVPITREQALIIQPDWAKHDWVMEGADPYDRERST